MHYTDVHDTALYFYHYAVELRTERDYLQKMLDGAAASHTQSFTLTLVQELRAERDFLRKVLDIVLEEGKS